MNIIPYGKHLIDDEDVSAVVDALRSDWITQGPKIAEFETALADYCGAKFAVAVSSGTAALHLAAMAAGLTRGDEVATSPISFIATANSVSYVGARPYFVDVEHDSANIDCEDLKRKITDQTKVIMPVHYSGMPCDIEEIFKVAKDAGAMVIEDACHAFGAEYKDDGKWIKVGSCQHSDMTVFSFHPVKSIATGEGGAILTNNKDLYDKMVMCRQHGVTKNDRLYEGVSDGSWYYEMQYLGYNYRITDLQSALGLSQLKKIDAFLKRRREIVALYNDIFKDSDYFSLPPQGENKRSSWHLYPIRLRDEYLDKKQEIFDRLMEKGIRVQVHYIPVYCQPYYQKMGYTKGMCPHSEEFYKREISIPIYPAMTDADVEYVANTLLDVFKNM